MLGDSADLKHHETLHLDLPSRADLPADTVYLSFRARIETQFQSGSAPALQVCVNGLPTSVERLRNKPPHYLFSTDRHVEWYSPSSSAWVLPYYPWDRTDVAGGHAHQYVLDITNLLRPTGNTLSFESFYDYVPDAIVQVRDVRLLLNDRFDRDPDTDTAPLTESRGLERFRMKALGYHSGAEAKLSTETAYRHDAGVVAPRKSFAQDYELAVDKRGQITIAVGGQRYQAFSWFRAGPGEWSSLGQDDSAGGWDTLRVEGTTVTCERGALALTRQVIRQPSHLEVRDRLTNHSDADLPVTLLNAVDVGDVAGIREFRISGQLQSRFWASTSPVENRRTAATPVVYVERDHSAVGLVMEDDAYRNQGSVLVWDSIVGLGDDMFYLAPGADYTFVWKLYPLSPPGYYTLVNALRYDWGLFQRIPGLFGFVHPGLNERMYEDVRCESPDEVAAWVRDTGIEIASSGVVAEPVRTGASRTLYGNEEMELLRAGTGGFLDWRAAMRERGVDVKCLPYLNPHLVRLVGDRTLDQVRERLPGCLIEDAWGTPVAYRTGWLYNVLPTLDNPCGRHLLEVLRLYMDEAGFDGIYLDEWDHSRARVSFSHEDGMSALLDVDGRLVRKVGIVPIMTRDFQVRFIEELVARDAVIFANQFDDTLTAAQLPVVHFAEPGGSYDEYLLAAAQLSRTPLSLHVKRTQGVWQDVREFLKRGLLTCYYWKYLHGDHVLKRCFPITVREIWPGVVIGEDRIVT
ncbi:MAG TPA: hypothetical protein VM283_07290, partial [Armatimonadota bacterium]|nr:hypothetical protein [Armatimonadota bacterium]